jgi:restriction system protein
VLKPEDAIDRAVTYLVRNFSGRVVAAVTLLFYPGVALALPIALGWSISNFVTANIIGTVFAAVVSIGWLTMKLEARDRRHLVEWTSDLRRLTSDEFEWFVGEVFRREGWSVSETGRQGAPDGGVDLELTRGADRVIVQCKRWTSWRVGVEEIRSFAGALLRDGLAGGAGIFVTLSDFTDDARREAARVGLRLLDGRDLLERVERVRQTEPCPSCGRPMVLDRSRHGWWFRCIRDGCTGKRDLAKEPARAVELLTEEVVAGRPD